jgi:D-proline reductase (dithiol) PrdB
VGLVSQAIERSGIPTVTLSMEGGVAAPRVASVPFPYNHPMGEPGDPKAHREVALAALALLHGMGGPGRVELPFEPWSGVGPPTAS